MYVRTGAALAMAALLCALPPVFAQQPGGPDCAEPLHQARVNQCAEADYQAAEIELTRVYEQALAQFREQDRVTAEEESQYAGAEMLLRASQQSWMSSRDDFCAARNLSSRGGSMGPTVLFSCRAMLTRSRTQALGWLLY